MALETISVLFSQEQVEKRIAELAQQINRDFAGETVHVICTLKGAMHFFTSLTQQLTVEVVEDIIQVTSYGAGTVSSGDVKILIEPECFMTGENIIVVEDIVDSGRTICVLREYFQRRSPKTVRICALLDKPSRRVVDAPIDYCGFEVDDVFVVGYGLDYDQKYRNLPYIGFLK